VTLSSVTSGIRRDRTIPRLTGPPAYRPTAPQELPFRESLNPILLRG
jgi:hypothetical protein